MSIEHPLSKIGGSGFGPRAFLRKQERGHHVTAAQDPPQAYDQYGPGGPYQRYRQMSLDDMLLDNRIVFLIGEISYQRAAEVIMKMLYLDNLNFLAH